MRILARGLSRFTLSVLTGSLLAFLLAVTPAVYIPEALAHRLPYVTPEMVGMVLTPLGFQGSGVSYSPGVVLTARHVVRNEGKATVIFNVDQVQADVSCVSEEYNDLAVLRLKNTDYSRSHDHPLELSPEAVVPGQVLLVAGYEMGRWIVYATYVKYIHGATVILDKGSIEYPEIIVVEHRSTGPGFGMSGGGAFDAEGRLVGIICCARQNVREVGIVPIHRGLMSCTP